MTNAVADDTMTRLLDAAGQVFAEKGYAAATVREICRRADANVAAVNYHYGDKDQLYRAALRHAFRSGQEHLPVPSWAPGTPPAIKLRDFVRELVTRMGCTGALPWQMQLLLRELTAPSAAGEELAREFIRPIYEILWDILGEVLPPDVSEERLHLIGFSIVGQVFYHRVARPVIALVVGAEEHARYTGERLAEHVAAFTLAALGLAAPLKEGVAS